MQPRIDELLQRANDRVRIGRIVGKLRSKLQGVPLVPVLRPAGRPEAFRARPALYKPVLISKLGETINSILSI